MLDIKFDTTKFTRKLRGIQISAIPEAQKKSLYKFGFVNKNTFNFGAKLTRNGPSIMSGVCGRNKLDHNLHFPKHRQRRQIFDTPDFRPGGPQNTLGAKIAGNGSRIMSGL